MFNRQKKIFKKIYNKLGIDVTKGTLVKCNPDECYISYIQFVKRHPQYMARFAYKCYPNTERVFRVLGVYNHVMEDFYDNNDFVVVVEDVWNKQIFLMGEHGLTVGVKRTKK